MSRGNGSPLYRLAISKRHHEKQADYADYLQSLRKKSDIRDEKRIQDLMKKLRSEIGREKLAACWNRFVFDENHNSKDRSWKELVFFLWGLLIRSKFQAMFSGGNNETL